MSSYRTRGRDAGWALVCGLVLAGSSTARGAEPARQETSSYSATRSAAEVNVEPPSGLLGGEKEESNFLFRYLDNVFGRREDPTESRFIGYPVLAYSPETDWEIGVSFLAVYYANDDPKNRLSEITSYAFATLAGQFGLILEHALYTDRDQWFILGEGKFQSFPLEWYGIGPNTPAEPQATIDELSLLIRERLLYKLVGSLYIGPEFNFDLIRGVRFNFAEGAEPVLPNGGEGSLNIGAGIGLVFDNRHNVLNVRDGLFSELALLHYDRLWGSDFEFTVVESDTRYFIPMNSRETLALQLKGRFSDGDVPFNELSTLGGVSLMRGYYLGRFRDRNFLGGQIEYRVLPFPFFSQPFWRRFGGSVFLGTGTVFPELDSLELSNFVVAGGVGLRFLLFPEKDIYTRLDVAFTVEDPTFYLFIGEAF